MEEGKKAAKRTLYQLSHTPFLVLLLLRLPQTSWSFLTRAASEVFFFLFFFFGSSFNCGFVCCGFDGDRSARVLETPRRCGFHGEAAVQSGDAAGCIMHETGQQRRAKKESVSSVPGNC
ncbi:hypothetical protein V8F33_000094 [Rhypophila sp. PSN 637]